MNLMRIVIMFIITLIFTNSVSAKIVISGHVIDEENEPIDVATTQILNSDGQTLYYQITDENGFFEYVINEDRLDANMIVECLGYEAYQMNVATDKDITGIVIRMKTKVTELKEIVVSAPEVVLKGDTVSYRMSAFVGKGDITLKDAMRNLPGVDISDNGKIKYLGKEISNLYIEGMDLLGGRYNVATDNLPVTAVTNVEILNNHQSVKMDNEIFSDNVAINVKLNSKAKFRPIGSYEAKGGYADDWLYQLSGSGMMFNSKFQSILNTVVGNVTEFAEKSNIDHYSNETLYSATQLLGDLGLSTPPLARDRFINPTDFFITLNTLNKTSDDATFRVNTGYSYTKTSYDYLSFRDYYSENGSVHINQEYSSMSSVHRPTVSLEYKLNSTNKYLTNTLTGNLGIKEYEVLSLLDGINFNQNENIKDFLIRNDFTSSWRTNNFRWNIASCIEYGATPEGYIEVEDDKNNVNNFIQHANSKRFLTKETVSAAYEHKNSRLWLPLSFLYSNNVIKSELNYPIAINNVAGNNVQIWFAPQYEYIHPMRKYVVRASANIKWDYLNVENKGTYSLKQSDSRFSISPYLYFNWNISPSSTLRTQISYLNRSGDVGDFLTAPVRTDNLNISYKTGVLSYQKSFNAMLHYDFKLPLDMWFINADMIYDNTQTNLITNNNITDSAIEVSPIPYLNNLENITGILNLTKIFSSINTKISLGGAYMWGRGSVSQNEIILPQYGQSYSILSKIIAKPWSFIEFDYDGNLTMNHMKFNNISEELLSHSHSFKLNLFPFKGFQVKMGADILWKELSESVAKSISLLDLGMSYKFSYFRIGIDLNNILNTRQYAYTIFSGINKFNYDYSLRGREILLSLSFTL